MHTLHARTDLPFRPPPPTRSSGRPTASVIKTAPAETQATSSKAPASVEEQHMSRNAVPPISAKEAAAADDGEPVAIEEGELLRFDFDNDGFLLEADPIYIQILRGAKGPFDCE
jgi:hypothetical protein